MVPGFMFPGCGCCGSCHICSTVPDVWEVDLSAVTNQNCTQCSLIAGVHEATKVDDYTEGVCRWLSDPIYTNCVPSGELRINILFNSGSIVVTDLLGIDTSGLLYSVGSGSVSDCLGEITLNNIPIGGNFKCNWPATITITPV